MPDLFREGQGAVIEGAFVNYDVFNATNVFAKHDENYMPASIKEDLKNNSFLGWIRTLVFPKRGD